jgi:DNA uptake protein ComE-like DNA-binding protein
MARWISDFDPRRQALRQRIARDPYYRFQNLDEIAIAVDLGIRIEVNGAAVDDWLRLPGISIHQARQWVELAQLGMQFLSTEDLAAAINIPIQRLQPFAKILSFCYHSPDSLLSPQRINPNTASVQALVQIPCLSHELSDRLITDREKNGAYQSLADLQRRLQFPAELIAQLMYYFQF